MNKKFAILALTALAFTASCGAKPASHAEITTDAASGAAMDSATDSVQRAANIPMTPQKIALAFNMGITLPEDKIDLAMRTDRANCEKAGDNVCQVLAYNFNNSPADVSANLQIRAVPEWLSSFRDSHAVDMQKLGGKVTNERADAENLTSQIQTTDTTLKDLISNRDRLLEQINSKTFKGEDLLEAQTRLDSLQREISQYRAQSQSNQARVQMSTMELDYYAERGGINRRVLAPVHEALSNFFDFFFRSLSALIYILAIALPFFVAWVVFLLLRNPIGKIYRRLNPKKIAAPKAQD